MSPGSLMHSIVNVDNNIELLLKYWIIAKRLDLSYSHHKNETVIMWYDRDGNPCYNDNHIIMYKCIKSVCFAP